MLIFVVATIRLHIQLVKVLATITMNRSTEILTTAAGNSQQADIPQPERHDVKASMTNIVMGWDTQKSYTFIGLLVCFFVWACLFFPLMEISRASAKRNILYALYINIHGYPVENSVPSHLLILQSTSVLYGLPKVHKDVYPCTIHMTSIHATTQSNIWNNRQNSTIVNTNPVWQGPPTTPWPDLGARKPFNQPASGSVSSSASKISIPNRITGSNQNKNVNTNVGANLSYGPGTGTNVGQNINNKPISSGNIDGIALSYGLNYNKNNPTLNQGKPISLSSTTNVHAPRPAQSYSNIVRQNSNDQSNTKTSQNTGIPTVKPLTQKVNSLPINTNNVEQPGKTIGSKIQPTAQTATIDEDEELRQFSEALLKKDVNNAAKYVTINYQGKTTSRSTNDEAELPLLSIQNEAYNIPSISNLIQLHNNYILETNVNEHVSAQEKMEENALLDSLLSTSIMQYTRNFLIQKGAIPKDPKLFKDKLKEIWFNMYSRGQGKIGSSGFEHVFLAEVKNQDVTGLHNWLYFHDAEARKSVNYLGYMKKLEMNNNKGAILKFHMNLNGIDKPQNERFQQILYLFWDCSWSNSSEITCMEWGRTQDEIILGQSSGTLRVYNALTSTISTSISDIGGIGSVVGAAVVDDNIFAVRKSGSAIIWNDDRKEMNIIASGGEENDLKLWDIKTKKPIFKAKSMGHDNLNLPIPTTIRGISFLGTNGNLPSCCTKEGHVLLYDERAQRRPTCKFTELKASFTAIANACREYQCLVGTTKGSVSSIVCDPIASKVVTNKSNKRYYQSENVFGFKRKEPNCFRVPEEIIRKRNENSNFYRLVTAYRQHAHKIANVNPIGLTISSLPDLDPKYYGLNNDIVVDFEGILNTTQKQGSILEALDFLKSAYCQAVGVEFLHLQTEEEIEWFAENYELYITQELDSVTKVKIATDLLKSQAFDHFMANKFVSVKRYSGEGAESMMAFFRELFRLCALDELEQIVIGMPHRGRLNFLTGFLNVSPSKIFAKLRGKPDFPATLEATGDILSHLISSTDINVNNKSLHVSVLYNPSHLEAALPVSMGKTRAKQMMWQDGDYSKTNNKWSDKVLNLQIHGDAALAGQGVNQETLQLSRVPHFEVGGSVHFVVNNQLGFTTPAERGRSSSYCTDVAKMVHVPVLHVNGDDPEMVLKATRVAFMYQRRFRKDVFIDLNCYRQWGHNELDDPTFTNPAIYKIIHARDTVPNLYAKKLIESNIWTQQDVEKVANEHKNWLNDNFKEVDHFKPEDPCFKRQWEGYQQAKEVITTWTTGLNLSLLKHIGVRSVTYPENFNLHVNLLKHHITNRLDRIAEGHGVDWSTAEALAIGSLLYQGYNVRISGQDVGRGTFSQRHAMLVDQTTNEMYIPLNSLDPNQAAYLEVANSILSEEAVVGFEYGMSIENPNNLIIWEAQFGDFFNGAQIMFDTLVSSGETKWLWSSGLTVLLPHGYDGAGPEHSSSRVERFLQMTDSKESNPDGDNINMQVSQPSTPAQYFHLLRRQMIRNFRKPLIIITPKTLLRLPAATSSLEEMGPVTRFYPVLGDKMCNPEKVNKILLTSGKHYYTLQEKRQSLNATNTAIIRLESFCPFPTLELREELAKYKNVKVILWCQEEPQNMGAWTFIKPRFEHLVGYPITYCGRKTMACPAESGLLIDDTPLICNISSLNLLNR
ncbi:hypothetical protein Trydic_g2045 [Trypoxylus dichotomus]